MSGEKKVDSKRKANETSNAEPEEEMPGPRQETPSTTADANIEAEFEKMFRELANTKIEGMPELTKLLLDDEVMDLFEDPDTINDLRMISIDPTNIEKLKDRKGIKRLMEKVDNAKKEIELEKGQEPANAADLPADATASAAAASSSSDVI